MEKKDFWHKTKETAGDVWRGTKNVTEDIWDGAKNMAESAKNAISNNSKKQCKTKSMEKEEHKLH